MQEVSVETALERMLAAVVRLPSETIGVAESLGRIVAAPVIASYALLPFANAGMDGFAVRSSDLAHASPQQPVRLSVIGQVNAGDTPDLTITSGTAVRIMTGAPLPSGTEAIVPIEDTDGGSESVSFTAPIAAGRHVRPAGEDVAEGEVAIPQGRPIGAAEIGLLAALGLGEIEVTRRPRVAIISTGNEILAPDEPLAPGKLRDANGPALAAFVQARGGIALSLGIARDSHADLLAKLQAAREQRADLVLTSAGASGGDFDVVRSLMLEAEALEVWKVAMKPGRPLLFGRLNGVPLVGLPGNPASALVVAELFLGPLFDRLSGYHDRLPLRVAARLASPQRLGPRRHYVRARLSHGPEGYTAHTEGVGSGSGALTTLVRANALLVLPEGRGTIAAGELVEALIL